MVVACVVDVVVLEVVVTATVVGGTEVGGTVLAATAVTGVVADVGGRVTSASSESLPHAAAASPSATITATAPAPRLGVARHLVAVRTVMRSVCHPA